IVGFDCKRDFKSAASQQDKPLPTLGNTIAGRVLNIPRGFVTKFPQSHPKITENLASLKARNVFNHDGLRSKHADESKHFPNKVITLITILLGPVASAKSRKSLAGRAAS